MRPLRHLPIKDPAERRPVTFDFEADIPVSDSISGATVTVEAVVEGTDGSPATILSGGASAVGRKVTQWIHGAVDGASYRLKCLVSTADGRVLVLRAVLPVQTET